MWKALHDTYATTSAARQFEIEVELGNLYQGNKDITTYYNEAKQLWTEQDLLSAALLSGSASGEVRAEKAKARTLQFLARLKPEYEAVRSTLLNREGLQLEQVLGALIREETRLRTQAGIDARPGNGDPSVFAVVKGSANNQQVCPSDDSGQSDGTAFAAYRPPSTTRREVECFHCHAKGHTKKYCRSRNFCVYCKKIGHIVPDCPVAPPRPSPNNRNMPTRGTQQGVASRPSGN
ncbi:unnamed protein product [Linum trigynum]|uniref:CCHC-type domain-containing protein n=1 Tax=Linum trigynum TaxID=586398 RepID=A0AAV2E502_9ROSI